MVSTVIFDLDGIIIDSEPLWHDSEIEAFNNAGVPLTKAHCIETQGIRIDEVVQYWFTKYPWGEPTKEKMAEIIVDGETGFVVPKGDVDKLAEALGRYLADPEMAIAHGKAGFARSMNMFTDEHLGPEVEAVVKQLLKS